MSIDHPDELAALRAAGRVVAETLRELARRVRPGVTTGRARRGRRHRLRPPRRPLRPAARLRLPRHGLHLDRRRVRARHPRPAPPARGPARQARRHRRARRLLRRRLPHRAGRARARARAAAGRGRAVGAAARPRRPPPRARTSARSAPPSRPRSSAAASASARELTGHGIGRRIHEEPDVPNVAWDGPELTNGLVITVEPIIAAGRRRRPRRRRRLDDPHRRRLAVGARRAHDRRSPSPRRSWSRHEADRAHRPRLHGHDLGLLTPTSATTRSRSRSSTARWTSA